MGFVAIVSWSGGWRGKSSGRREAEGGGVGGSGRRDGSGSWTVHGNSSPAFLKKSLQTFSAIPFAIAILQWHNDHLR